MHYLGFVFVEEPTRAAVEAAMDGHGDGRHWDWFVIGGRWDGYFRGEEEMCRRGQNPSGDPSMDGNAVRAANYNGEPAAFFVHGGDFIPREYFDEYEPDPETRIGENGLPVYYGRLKPTPDYEKRFAAALAEAKAKELWIVAVDAHN